MREGDVVPRRFLPVLSADEPPPLTKGSGRLELAEAIVRAADRDAGDRQPRLEMALRHRPRRYAEQLRQARRAADATPSCSSTWRSRSSTTAIRSRSCTGEIMLERASTSSSSADSPANVAKDAGNRFYWRANRRRMTRRADPRLALFVVRRARREDRRTVRGADALGTRRTLYGKVSRYKLDQFLQLFDFPAATIRAEQRFTTNVPLQRLFLMNSDFMQQQASGSRRSLQRSRTTRPASRRPTAWCFGREPAEAEVHRRPRVPRRRAAARLRRAQGGATKRRRRRTQPTRRRRRSPQRRPRARRHADGRHDGRRASRRRPAPSRREEAASGDAARPLPQGASELVGVPLHRLTGNSKLETRTSCEAGSRKLAAGNCVPQVGATTDPSRSPLPDRQRLRHAGVCRTGRRVIDVAAALAARSALDGPGARG